MGKNGEQLSEIPSWWETHPQTPFDTVAIPAPKGPLRVRLHGGYLDEFSPLGHRNTGLYASRVRLPDIFSTRFKPNASHPMRPVGPHPDNPDFPPQHGLSRVSMYKIIHSIAPPKGSRDGGVLVLQRTDPYTGIIERRIIHPTADGLTIQGTFYDKTEDNHSIAGTPPLGILHIPSFGEHLYFKANRHALDTLRILPRRDGIQQQFTVAKKSKNREPLVQRPLSDLTDFISQGIPIWTQAPADGRMAFRVPKQGGGTYGIAITGQIFTYSYRIDEKENRQGNRVPLNIPMDLIIWHRRGTPSVCLEPAWGLSKRLDVALGRLPAYTRELVKEYGLSYEVHVAFSD